MKLCGDTRYVYLSHSSVFSFRTLVIKDEGGNAPGNNYLYNVMVSPITNFIIVDNTINANNIKI